jgi:cystathionine beta-lyase
MGNGRYEIDWDAFEEDFDDRTRLYLLCNPHNPIGRVFERDELERMAEICIRRDVIICSDEIHSDLIFSEHKHIPIASLSPEVADRTITTFAPSKTFNIPGLGISFMVIQNKELKKKVEAAGAGLVHVVNGMSFAAAIAAYKDSKAWLSGLLEYLEANRDYLVEFVRNRLEGVEMVVPEATYLGWLDCRSAGIQENPHKFFLEHANVAMNNGATFGQGGEGFVRLNFGCPRTMLVDALERMEQALKNKDS